MHPIAIGVLTLAFGVLTFAGGVIIGASETRESKEAPCYEAQAFIDDPRGVTLVGDVTFCGHIGPLVGPSHHWRDSK